jgi:hypothetical protein
MLFSIIQVQIISKNVFKTLYAFAHKDYDETEGKIKCHLLEEYKKNGFLFTETA